MTDMKELSEIIAKMVAVHWDKHKRPLMLSDVSPELKREDPPIDYKTVVLPPRTLKKFIKEDLANKIKVIEHPDQKAKIALVPASESYEFDLGGTPDLFEKGLMEPLATHSAKKARPNNRFIVTQFLQLIGRLAPEEAEKVEIPVSVLVKLLRDQ